MNYYFAIVVILIKWSDTWLETNLENWNIIMNEFENEIKIPYDLQNEYRKNEWFLRKFCVVTKFPNGH